jgi:DNA end-binding protein Ku
MPQAVWTGALGFGLVTIPVALYPATRSKDVRFHLFDPETGARIRYRRVAEAAEGRREARGDRSMDARPGEIEREPPDDEPVDRSEPEDIDRRPATTARRDETEVATAYGSLLRGYEIEPDRFVMVQAEELARIRPERSEAIEIEDFVSLADIDPVYYEKAYHVVPRGDAAAEPYALLLEAMDRAGRVGIGRFVLRTRPHLVAIRPSDGGLILQTLYFADEVAAVGAPRAERGELREREVRLAIQLVEALATEWVPERYGDDYRQELLELLSTKEPVEATPDVPSSASASAGRDVERLLDALQRSVDEAKRRGRHAPRRATG